MATQKKSEIYETIEEACRPLGHGPFEAIRWPGLISDTRNRTVEKCPDCNTILVAEWHINKYLTNAFIRAYLRTDDSVIAHFRKIAGFGDPEFLGIAQCSNEVYNFGW